MQTKNINQQSLLTIKNLPKTGSYLSTLISIVQESEDGLTNIATEVDGNSDKITPVGGSHKTPPPYRMPPQPLYNEPVPMPGSTTPSLQQMHTHSNKFPIEREVILNNYDKNSKIPILNEYHRKHGKSSAVAPDVRNIQVAWTEDRANRTQYSEVRNGATTSNVPQNIALEYHRTYKAQPLSILETSNGTEPSPIVNQDDSNGFISYQKSNGRSHSTPETEISTQPNKAFPSRTYHTIKDMISSRFNKSKTDQNAVENLNNCENNEQSKTESNLSPHSQLIQRGVYLANLQSCNRNVYGNNNIDSTKRNPEMHDHFIGHYRERAVDVAHTAGVCQQTSISSTVIPNGHSYDPKNQPVTPIRQTFNTETPNRFRDSAEIRNRNPRVDLLQSGNTSRNVKKLQSDTPNNDVIQLDEMCNPSVSNACFSAYNRNQTSHSQIISEQSEQKKLLDNYAIHVAPSTSREILKQEIDAENQIHQKQKPNDNITRNHGFCQPAAHNLKHSVDRIGAGISKARSNDHLLENNNNSNRNSSCARKELSVKQKSKSFENLGNDVIEQENKIEIKSKDISSDCEKHRCGGQSDSGRGSTVYSSGKLKHSLDTSPDSSEPHRTANKSNQWVDMVENELKHILEPKSNTSITNSTLSDTSASPPLPPVSPDVSSDEITPAYKHKSLLYDNKMDTTYRSAVPSSHKNMWNPRSNAKDKLHQRLAVTMKRPENSNKALSTVASSSIDLDSMLDEDNNTSDEDISISDTRAIRKQLEGLENMYAEVMRLLGIRKSALRYQTPDTRVNKRRLYGSMSSLPSSVSSRPLRDRYRREDKKKFVRDIKGINKRFQRLESHVVTLARSVAHLSSEMRTQHLMIQEMEVIRNELTNLRAQTNMLTVRSQSMPRFHFPNTEQFNSSPDKMKKLTKFFGDEPPLLRIFLKKLGYEKYANIFEKEKIGLVELPYMSEERLQKLGIPMGPRLRIIQEAQLGFPGTCENTLCIV